MSDVSDRDNRKQFPSGDLRNLRNVALIRVSFSRACRVQTRISCYKLHCVAGVRIKYSRGLYLWNVHEIYIVALCDARCMHRYACVCKYHVIMHFAVISRNITQLSWPSGKLSKLKQVRFWSNATSSVSDFQMAISWRDSAVFIGRTVCIEIQELKSHKQQTLLRSTFIA